MATTYVVDRRSEVFGAGVTIADLAVHSFADHDADRVTVYDVWAVLERDWYFELDCALSELEYAIGVSARFRDGVRPPNRCSGGLLRRHGMPALSRLLICLSKGTQP